MLITEITANSENSTGFIELKNCSNHTIDFDTTAYYLSVQTDGVQWNDLKLAGYHPLSEFHPHRLEKMKHYPRLIHKKKIGAVEIHKAVVDNQAFAQLNYEKIEQAKQNINGVFIPSFNKVLSANTKFVRFIAIKKTEINLNIFFINNYFHF